MRVLFVDDDYITIASIVDHLRLLGHDVEIADGTLEAVDRLSDVAYDLLLLDVMLPPEGVFTLGETAEGRYTGLRLLERLRESPGLTINREVRVVLITNWRDEPQVDRVAHCMNAEILRKPLTLAAVERYLC